VSWASPRCFNSTDGQRHFALADWPLADRNRFANIAPVDDPEGNFLVIMKNGTICRSIVR
jgi:hypothetical protein